jgi:hypothetical protein
LTDMGTRRAMAMTWRTIAITSMCAIGAIVGISVSTVMVVMVTLHQDTFTP